MSAACPEMYRRALLDVLTSVEVESLQGLCVWVAAQVLEPLDRMTYLSSIGREDREGWAELLASALATDPDQVEAWLVGCAPVPGSMQRLRERTGCLLFTEAAEKARQEAHAAREERMARQRATARCGASGAPQSLPREWLDTAARVSLGDVLPQLGLTPRRGSLGPCPVCGADVRSDRDRRLPVVLLHGGEGWQCWPCGAKGGSLAMVQAVLHGSARWTSPEERAAVGRWFQEHGWL